MDTFKNIFLTIGCVAFAFVIAICVLMCVPSTRTGIYRMLNVSPSQEKSDLVEAKTELYIETINYKARLDSLKTEKNRIQSQVESLQEDYDEGVALLSSYQSRIDTLNSQLSSSESDNANLQNQINALNSDVQILNGQITGYTNEIARLNNDLTNLSENATNLTNQIAILETAKNALQIDYDLLNSEVGSLRMSNNRLNAEISSLQLTNEEQENQIYSLNLTITELNEQIMQLQDELMNYQTGPLEMIRVSPRKQLTYADGIGENGLHNIVGECGYNEIMWLIRSGSEIKGEFLPEIKTMEGRMRAAFSYEFAPKLDYYYGFQAVCGNQETYDEILAENRLIDENFTIEIKGVIDEEEMTISEFEDLLNDSQYYKYSVEFDESWDIGTQMITNLIVKVHAYTQWQ